MKSSPSLLLTFSCQDKSRWKTEYRRHKWGLMWKGEWQAGCNTKDHRRTSVKQLNERAAKRREKCRWNRNNSSHGAWGVKKARERKLVSTALRVIAPLAWTIHLKLIFQLGPAGHSESISNWSLCQRSGKLAVELIRNIVVLWGSDRETYHTAQQEMGSEPPGAERGRSCSLYTHTDSMSLRVPNPAVRWHMLPSVQHSKERARCAEMPVLLHTYRAPGKIQTLSEHNMSIYF